MDEPAGHDAKLNKPVTKRQICYDLGYCENKYAKTLGYFENIVRKCYKF